LRTFGLLDRRERWGFTLRGWTVCGLLLLSGSTAAFFCVHPFLAVSAPVRSDLLVVEGWLPSGNVRAATEIIGSGRYRRVFVTGGPIDGTGEYDPNYGTYAGQGYRRLRDCGANTNLLVLVPSPSRKRDRTFTEAVALKEWFEKSDGLSPSSFNLLTVATHARRSRLLFQKAFGREVDIGVIALPPVDYPANRWWHYSAGVKEVLSEAISYLYVRLFFWP
jgi:hypothetical protein